MIWKMFTEIILIFSLVFISVVSGQSQFDGVQDSNTAASSLSELYKIEGKVYPVDGPTPSNEFVVGTKIIVNYGQYFGFLRSDGSFEITNIPPGSYVIEVSNADYFYDPIRVDVNSRGKIRARKINYIQTTEVIQLSYPLKFKSKAPFKYFQTRESWKITDFIFNPMVLMMVLPLIFIMIVPKIINPQDVETQKELQNLHKSDFPELSEMMTNWLGNNAAGNNSNSSRPSTSSGHRDQPQPGQKAIKQKKK